MSLIRSWIGYLLLAFFSFLMLKITLPYLSMDDHTGFLRIKQHVINIGAWKLAFYVHVFTSMFALLAGFTQFSPSILANRSSLHRSIGKLYIVVILLLSGPSGLIMALYANGGWVSQLAFALLSVCWWGTTFLAYRAIRQRKIRLHQEMMWRSYALTLSALTLRAWKWLIVWSFEPHPMDVYMIVAWLGWVPNLLLIEWMLHRKKAKVLEKG